MKTGENNTPNPNHPTASQIASWKKEHGAVHQITVEGKIIILRQPKLKDLERAQASDPKRQKPYNFQRSIIANCKLYVEDGLLEDDGNYLAVCSAIDEIIEIKDAELKKL